MKINIPTKILNVLVRDRSSVIFILAAVLSFSFSMAVILGTVGIMDGFESTLKKGLNQSSGDVIITKSDSFFLSDAKILKDFKSKAELSYSTLIHTQGFVVSEGVSKGAVIYGIEPASFEKVSSLSLPLKQGEVIIGVELAQLLKLKEKDLITLAFANGDQSFNNLAKLKSFTIAKVIDHGLYEKNMRALYLLKEDVQSILDLKGKSNQLVARLKHKSVEAISDFVREFNFSYGPLYRAYPYWHEFAPLLEAVEVEKLTLTLVLQIVVLVAIFNVLALIIFLKRKRAKEIFILQALGLSKSQLMMVWLVLIVSIWFISCLLSQVFVLILNQLLASVSWLQLPAQVYGLSRISISLGIAGYAKVYFMSLFWAVLFSYLLIKIAQKKTIISGLRKEFN